MDYGEGEHILLTSYQRYTNSHSRDPVCPWELHPRPRISGRHVGHRHLETRLLCTLDTYIAPPLLFQYILRAVQPEFLKDCEDRRKCIDEKGPGESNPHQ